MKKTINNIIVSTLLLSAVSLAFASNVTEDPIERQMLNIAAKLRCTVCQNEPVSESRSGLARDMRSAITEKLQAGQDEQKIIRFFVERYGDYVLLAPPKSGNGIALWIFPPLFLLLAVIASVLLMKLRSEQTVVTPPSPLSEEDKERINRARSEDMNNNKSGENG